MFKRRKLFVYDFETSEFKDITSEMKGELLEKKSRGTATLVGIKIINICDYGTKVIYLDELKCQKLEIDLKQFAHTANLHDGKIILIFGGENESALLRGLDTKTE